MMLSYSYGRLEGIITCHVDEFFGMVHSFGRKIIDNPRKILLFVVEQSEMFKNLGLRVRQQSDKSIVINQHTQVDDL